MKIGFGRLLAAAALSVAASFSLGTAAQASPAICPTTANTNTDCGFIITIGAGNAITGQAVAGALPYDGSEDSLIGVINNSGATFTGPIALTGSGIFGFDGDGICFIGSTGGASTSYCNGTQSAGNDPFDYEGPLNTFVITDSSDGIVDIAGLAAGASTFFSLEGPPSSLNITLPPTAGSVPEPITLSLFGAGLAGAIAMRRRKKLAA